MATDYGVTSGHELYSTHRFRDDTKHMIIFDTIDDDTVPYAIPPRKLGLHNERAFLHLQRWC